MKNLICLLLIYAFLAPSTFAQEMPVMDNPVVPTPAEVRMTEVAQRQILADNSLVANVELRNVGPTVMSGRVVDVDVNPADPTHFYVAYASGGLWETTNNGMSFTPLFDDQASMTLGDIAVDWAHGETIWAGTGENNSSRSSYAGTGVYKSEDGGATWTPVGLDATQRTGRIILHPDDPNTVWVAASGALYSPSADRGVYKTIDGGQTWRKTLFVDDNTGAIDLLIDPNNTKVLYTAMWHRERRAWNFVESGPGSGIYKSIDGGDTWAEVSIEGSGFPTGSGVGRIGLALYPGTPGILYAILDNQNRRPDEEEDKEQGLTRDALLAMTATAFMDVSDEDLEAYLRDNNFPQEYTAESVREQIRKGEIAPKALVEFLEDANSQLFDTPVIGAEVYRSDDGGSTWTRTHEDYIDNLYYSYGYYFGEIRVAPDEDERIYIMGVPILKSEDGGQTFTSINEPNVHSDHHALWVSPTRPGHIINGNDGGLNISYDDGETWFKANTPSVGQFYAVQVDEATPYNVYGGLQDNGVWFGPHTYEASMDWYDSGDYPYDRLMGGDGMQVEVDTRTNDVVYTGFQFGNYFRIDRAAGETQPIKPRHTLGERPLRFNWQSPVHLSRHNQDILYFGSNKLHRSFNRGDDWETLSGDLTKGGRPGDVPYGTLTTIDESPLQFGLLYVGSDDGYIHVSRDAGNTWTRISDTLPQDLWVSRVEASNHKKGRIYVALNGYRWDNFEAYVYASGDYGQTWQRLGTDLPEEPVNVILEDPVNEDLLYVGTDHGLYISLDRGQSFMAMGGGVPNVPIHDLKIQARDKDLVVGTHGRSMYIADIAQIQQLTTDMLAKPMYVFAIDPVTHRSFWGDRNASWQEFRVPEVEVPYFAGAVGEATIRIKTDNGSVLRTLTDTAEHGLNYALYDLSVDAKASEHWNHNQDDDDEKLEAADNGSYYLRPGTYTVEIELDGDMATGTLEVKGPQQRGNRAEPIPSPEEIEETK